MSDTNPNSTEDTGAEQAAAPIEIKKIKIVISDLHLGKGKLMATGGLNDLEEFFFDDKLIEFLNYYSTGLYKDHEVELIINGDFLNFLQVDFKGHFLTVLTESVCYEIMLSILDGHKKVFKAMADFASRSGKSITYIVGNHDQAMLWPSCRDGFDRALRTKVKYKNIVYYFDGVHIEHGHMHEAANRFDPRRFFLKKNLAEPILNLPFGSHFFVENVLKIKHEYPFVDKIRPFGKMVRWALFNETQMTIKTVASTFGYFVRSLLRKDNKKNWSFRNIVKIILESAIFPDLGGAARKILNDERVHTVVFGHSHVYQYRQWGHNKEYFNTGTWTDLTSLDIVSLGKITKLTYVLIDYQEGAAGRPRGRLKEWYGFHRIEEDVAVS